MASTDTNNDSDIITLGAIDCGNFCLKCYDVGHAWFKWRNDHIRNTLQVLAPEPETRGPPLNICDNCALYIIRVVFLNTISFEDAETGATITAYSSGSNTPTPPSPPITPPSTIAAAADNNTGAEPNIIRVATITSSPEPTTINSGSNIGSVEPTSDKRQQRSPSLPRCPKQKPSIEERLGNKQPTIDERLSYKQPSSYKSPRLPIDDRLDLPANRNRIQTGTRDRRDYSRRDRHSSSSSSCPYTSADRRRQRLLDHGHSYTTTYVEIIKNADRNK